MDEVPRAGEDAAVFAGNALRVDFSADSADRILAGLYAEHSVAAVTPLVSAPAYAADPGHRTTEPVRSLIVGVPNDSMYRMHFTSRLAAATTDAAVWSLLAKDPRQAIEKSVWGMLPKNRLSRQLMRKLKVYAGPEHPHQAQKAQPFEITQISQ